MSPAPQRHGGGPRRTYAPVPRVSVVVPVKDTAPALLCDAVRSATHQDCSEPIEVVVWNDGSTAPSTLDALAELSRGREGRWPVRIGGTADNRGISAARNAACLVARGEWLLWLDSDDTLPSGAVRHLMRSARGHPQIVFGRCLVTRADGRQVVRSADEFVRRWRNLHLRGELDDPLLSAVFAVHGGLVHRDLFWGVGGFDRSLRYAELTDWMLRVMREIRPDRVALVSETTYRHVRRSGSHSSARDVLDRRRRAVLRRYGQTFDRPVQPRFNRRCDSSGALLYDLLSDSGVSVLRPVHDS